MSKHVLICNKVIADNFGPDLSLVFSQIEYWISRSGKTINNENSLWIYNSLEEWHKQFSFWSLSKLRRIIKSLEQKDLIISKKINSKKWNQTKWYSINLDEYNKLLNNKDVLDKKRTDRFVQNEQMLLKKTENNYTNKSSYEKEEVKIKNNEKIIKLTECTKIKNIIPSKEQEYIAKQMVKIWNDSFECSLSPVKAFVNKRVIVQLNKIMQTKFENNIEAWKLYAQAVNSSKFLMGEKETKYNFKAQFLWLIKEETIDSIQNGAYGVGDRLLDSETVDENLKICKKEVQQMVQEKVASQIQEKTSNETEKQEFSKYLINREYEKDGDKYLIQKHMESIGSKYMYGGYITPSHVFYSGNEKYKKRLFQSYLMKKYYDIDETGISSSLNHVKQGVEGKSMLLKFKNIRDKLRSQVFQGSNFHNSFIGITTNRFEEISTTYV